MFARTKFLKKEVPDPGEGSSSSEFLNANDKKQRQIELSTDRSGFSFLICILINLFQSQRGPWKGGRLFFIFIHLILLYFQFFFFFTKIRK